MTDLFGIAPYGEAIKEATKRSLDAAGAFLSRICLPAAEEYGLMLRDKVAARRAQLTAARVTEAAQMIAAAGAEPREVPMRTLVPLLEGAGIEDDRELTHLWSALLANAAHPASPTVPPIFPATLRQLSPLDARILTTVRIRLARGLEPDPERPSPRRWGVKIREIASDLPGVDDADLKVSLTTLSSLGLLALEPVLRADDEAIFFTDADEVLLSPLGNKFMEACDPPRGSQRAAV